MSTSSSSFVFPVPVKGWLGGVCPSYYEIDIREETITPFDIIEALNLGFNLGCVVKYVLRAGRKTESPLEDLKKARNCLDREITHLEKKK